MLSGIHSASSVRVSLWLSSVRVCFKENSWLHISTETFLRDFFDPNSPENCHFISQKIWWLFLVVDTNYGYFAATFLHLPPPDHKFITAETPFHRCTFVFITAHFVHHCTLKHALSSVGMTHSLSLMFCFKKKSIYRSMISKSILLLFRTLLVALSDCRHDLKDERFAVVPCALSLFWCILLLQPSVTHVTCLFRYVPLLIHSSYYLPFRSIWAIKWWLLPHG